MKSKNANGTLEDAIRELVRAQAQLVANQAKADDRIAKLAENQMEIRGDFAEIRTILLRLLDVLPEAVRDKIWIKSEKQP